MSDDVHHYHHSEGRLTIDLDVTHTTRGDTWEIDVKGADGPEAAIAAFVDTRDRLLPTLLSEAKAEIKVEVPEAMTGTEAPAKPTKRAKVDPEQAVPA